MRPNRDRTITSGGAARLMQLLLEGGHLNGGGSHHHDGTSDDKKASSQKSGEEDAATTDSETDLVPTQFGTYFTSRKALKDAIIKELEAFGGRLSITELHDVVGVTDSALLDPILGQLQLQQPSADDRPLITRVGDVIMLESYLQLRVDELVVSLYRTNGVRPVAHVAMQEWNLPLEFTLAILQSRLTPTHKVRLLTQRNGTKAIVSDAYLDELETRFHGALLAVTARPVTIEQICERNHWDEPAWIRSLIVPRLEATKGGRVNNVPGEFHGNLYIPHSYVERQKKAASEHFLANGCIAFEDGQSRWGLAPSILQQHLQSCHGDDASIVLSDVMVHRDAVVTALEALVQEAVASQTWVDLTPHLPSHLLSKEDDCRTLLVDHVINGDDDGSDGWVVMSSDMVLFASRTMAQAAIDAAITPLVEPWAKCRARELDGIRASETIASLSTPPPHKDAKKSKRSSSKKMEHENIMTQSDALLPLDQIVDAMKDQYPDLADETNDAVVCQLCEEAFYTDEPNRTLLHSMCDRALQAELKRLATERLSKVTIQHKASAAKSQDIQSSFEDSSCFATACYLIQGFASFMEYAGSVGDEEQAGAWMLSEEALSELRRDLLLGFGSDFTRRLTQYCWFRHELDDTALSFRDYSTDAEEDVESQLPLFCTSVSPISRQYPKVFLACPPEGIHVDGGSMSGPLEKIRGLLPPTVGIALARQWILCGAESYQGGSKAGSLVDFLTHVEENCLTICGLPFKRLDKKAKKQFLNTRRQLLVQALEAESDPVACLEYAIMLLFQLVKNHVVFGSHLRDSVMLLLAKEKKISEEVARALMELSEQIASGDSVDFELVDRVKSHCLGKK